MTTTSSIDTTYLSSLTTTSSESSSETSTQSLDESDFLKLLLAEIQYQDPLDPMDNSDFAAQMAQFSSLEQLLGVNEALAGIQKTLESNQISDVLNYIGKDVETSGNTISIQNGEVDSGAYALASGADVKVTIYNDEEETVRKIDAGWQESGYHSVGWDGLDDDGLALYDGTYTFEIEAVDSDGNAVSAETYSIGQVTGITYDDNNTPYLMVGENSIALDKVLEIKNHS